MNDISPGQPVSDDDRKVKDLAIIAGGLTVGSLPVLCMGGLGVVNFSYISQLFMGPPIGANIPGLAIPCGWAILAPIFFGVLLADLSVVALGLQNRLIPGDWKLMPVLVIPAVISVPLIVLVLLGPAAV